MWHPLGANCQPIQCQGNIQHQCYLDGPQGRYKCHFICRNFVFLGQCVLLKRIQALSRKGVVFFHFLIYLARVLVKGLLYLSSIIYMPRARVYTAIMVTATRGLGLNNVAIHSLRDGLTFIATSRGACLADLSVAAC